MALQFFDGFDHHNIWDGVYGRKWDIGSFATQSSPRFPGQGFAVAINTPGIKKTIASPVATMITGFALMVTNYSTQSYQPVYPIFQVLDATRTSQLDVYMGTSGELIFKQGNAVVGTSQSYYLTYPYLAHLVLGAWYYVEIKLSYTQLECHISGAVGSGPTQLIMSWPYSGTYQLIGLQGITLKGRADFNSLPIYVDDLYIIDTTSSINNDFLGDCRVQTRYPDASGNYRQFTPSQPPGPGVTTSANQANMVNQPVVSSGDLSDGPTSKYNFDGNVGDTDSYSIGNFTVAGEIFGVQSTLFFRKDDVGARKIQHTARVANVDFQGSQSYDGTSQYTFVTNTWEVNPDTGLPWDLTALNQAEFGAKISA